MKIRVGHLYPDYLNIYADRGNIAVLTRRAEWRGHELEVDAIGMGEPVEPGAHDLYYVGGGQDREQALVAHDLAGKDGLVAAVEAGAALLAVCGGYQLLGRFYRERSGAELPGVGLFPLHTLAGDRRMIGDVLARLRAERRQNTHAGRIREPRRSYDPGLGRRAARPRGCGLRQRRRERVRGLPCRACDRDVPSRAPPPPEPMARGLAPGRSNRPPNGRRGPGLRALDDELEDQAHTVSAARARSRGGRYG